MAARQNNPRKFSDKIALMNQRQEAKTSEFQAIMKEVSMVKPIPRSRRGNTLMPRHPYPGHEVSHSCPDNGTEFDNNYGVGGDSRVGLNFYNDQFGQVPAKDRGGGVIRPRSREKRSPSPYNRDISPHSYYRASSPNSTSCSPHSRYSSSNHSPSTDHNASSQVILLPRKSSPTNNYLCPPSTANIRRSSSDSNIYSIPWDPPLSPDQYTGFQLPPSPTSQQTQDNVGSNLQFTCPVNLVPRDQCSAVLSNESKEVHPNNTQSVSRVKGDSSPTIIITSCDNESRNFLHMNTSVITVNKNHKNVSTYQDTADYRAPFSPASPGSPESLNDNSSQNSPVEAVSRISSNSTSPVNNHQSPSSPIQYAYQSPQVSTSTSSLSHAVDTIQLNVVEDIIQLNGAEDTVRLNRVEDNVKLDGVENNTGGAGSEHTVENIATNDSISLDDWMKINLATLNQVLVDNEKGGPRRKDSDEVCEILQSTNKSDLLFEPISEVIDEDFIANLLSG